MRQTRIARRTTETDIQLEINLDGSGQHDIETGVGFLDHMLRHIAVHGRLDLNINASGDIEIDVHHTVEDCAIVLGQAIDEALGDRAGITRIASAYVPMDDSLAFVAIDLSGRSYCVFEAEWQAPMVGTMPTSLLEHFIASMAVGSRANIHCQLLYSRDDHHGAEAIFKALGRALAEAIQLDPRLEGEIPSTKGTLAKK